jgi:hypothetical protein
MKLVDLSLLREEILSLARESTVGRRVRDVVVEAGDDGEGGEVLRVELKLNDISQLTPEDVEPLVRSIEDAVAEKDERLPSVRFDEAA